MTDDEPNIENVLVTIAEEVMEWEDVEVDHGPPFPQVSSGGYKYLRPTWSCAGMVVDKLRENNLSVTLTIPKEARPRCLVGDTIERGALGDTPQRAIFRAALKAVRDVKEYGTWDHQETAE